MFSQFLSTIIALFIIKSHAQILSPMTKSPDIMAEKSYSLSDRYSNTYVNNVFSDNILLTLAYMSGTVKNKDDLNWDKVRGNFTYKIVIKPGATFAFHNAVLPQFQGQIAETTNAHFSSDQGFESDGWLVGDGVCHLASFMNVVARSAGLNVLSPTPHNFAKIADVPAKYGVAIYYAANTPSSDLQNLYITNNVNKPIAFIFKHTDSNLDISVEKLD